MDAPTRNDVLASNLLFATIGLAVLYQLAGWISQGLALPHNYFSHVRFNLLTVAGVGLFLLLRGALYYGVRRGLLAAKLLVALGFAVALYTTTNWQAGMIAGVYFGQFSIDSLVMLLSDLLTLAALVVMFWPTKEDARLL